MIFRALKRVQLRRHFGEFVTDEQITEVMAGTTEWQAFQSLLPAALRPKVATRSEAIEEVQRLIGQAVAARDSRRAL